MGTQEPDQAGPQLRGLGSPRDALWLRVFGTDRETLGLLFSVTMKRRGAVAVTLVASIVSALFEGTTLAAFALALEALTASDLSAALGGYGRVGALLLAWKQSMPIASLFPLLIGLAIGSQLLRSGFRFAGEVASARVLAELESDFRQRVFGQAIAMSYAQTRAFSTGDISSHFEQIGFLSRALQKLLIALSQLFLVVVYLGVLVWLSPRAMAITVFGLVLATASMSFVVRRARCAGEEFRNAMVRINSLAVDYLHNLKSIHLFSQESSVAEKVNREVSRSMEARRSGFIWQGATSPLIDALAAVAIGLFLIIGYSYLGDGHQAYLARSGAFLAILYRMVPRLSAVNSNWVLFHSYMPFAERVAGFLRETDKHYVESGSRDFPGLKRSIEFKEVSLLYANSQAEALTDVSFEIALGETVALVGPSGGGKSSLADLLLRLTDPTAGRIMVDGVDLRELDLSAWRWLTGTVSQETFLLRGTVRENLLFAEPRATEADLQAALKDANATDFVADLPEGLDTPLGDSGFRLSGGQRQRLAIARAILRRAQILVLDEATSDLDSRSEADVQAALKAFGSDRTALIVAHRLSTIADADLILVLDQGHIVERGTHDQLLAREGLYSIMWKLQAQVGDRSDELA